MSDKRKGKPLIKGRGRKPIDKWKKEQSLRKIGTKRSEEIKNKMSERLIGHPFWGNKKHADKTKQKIRIGNLNKIISQETKEKIRKKAFGRTHTSETKEKLREANFGKIHTSNTKEKMSKSHLGKKHTPQAIENMIKAQNNPITLQKNKEIRHI